MPELTLPVVTEHDLLVNDVRGELVDAMLAVVKKHQNDLTPAEWFKVLAEASSQEIIALANACIREERKLKEEAAVDGP